MQILHRFTDAVLFEKDVGSMKLCVEAAVEAGANLVKASLYGANLDGASLVGASLVGASLVKANLDGANLDGASLYGASLDGANLDGANLYGANLVDGGQERRGHRFWAWHHEDGHVVYRGGCHEWARLDDALEHYSETYSSSGDRHECAGRLRFMAEEAERRGWAKSAETAAA